MSSAGRRRNPSRKSSVSKPKYTYDTEDEEEEYEAVKPTSKSQTQTTSDKKLEAPGDAMQHYRGLGTHLVQEEDGSWVLAELYQHKATKAIVLHFSANNVYVGLFRFVATDTDIYRKRP